ncbi:MAG: insulinase family protein [Chthonomonas sp.]|nr:insulinase family protein [Chthonomonas sp.]
MSTITKHTLPNGARILVEPNTNVNSAAIGLWCRTGSRHETDAEAGITHFIEHMLFKGTKTRTAKDIAESIEGRGGVLNAFTDKEHTCYYCRVLDSDVPNGIDVLTDMVLNSVLDPEEIARECGVIQEEIRRGEDEPGDHVHELHLGSRWGEHPLGKPIIGTHDSVASFRHEHFAAYMHRRYRADNIVLAIAGRVEIDEILRIATPLLEQFESASEPTGRATKPESKTAKREVAKEVEQVHFCIGGDGWSSYDDDLYVGAVLDAVSGSGMSSRLFQEVRERRGLAYAIGSYSLSYSSAGAFTVYGGTGRQTWEAVQEVVRAEFDKLMKEPIPEEELMRAKNLMRGNMVLALEGMSARMMRMSRNELVHEREIPMEETLAKLDAVTAEDVMALANKILPADRVSTTAIGPF